MGFALNQTPPTGADTVWTLLQVAINPRAYQPVVPPPFVFDDCDCNCSGPCHHRRQYSDCGPCGSYSLSSFSCHGSQYMYTCDPPDFCQPCCGGWTVKQSGGGGTGGQYTICGLIQKMAADLAVPFSWFVLEGPPYVTSPRPSGGVVYHRQWKIQRGADNTQWRIYYSARAGFTGGTPGPTQTPSAIDEQPILGGGTDAAPTFGTLLPPDGTYRAQIHVYEDGLQPGLYLVTYPIGSAIPNACFLIDSLAPGSYPMDSSGASKEQDPIVIYQRTGADTLLVSSLASELSGPMGWLNYTYTLPPAQAFVRLPATFDAVFDAGGVPQVVIPRGLNQGILEDAIDTGRATYVRRAALGGTTARKGDASGWLWNGIAGIASGQLVGQKTGHGANPYFWATFGDVLLRWDGVTKQVLT